MSEEKSTLFTSAHDKLKMTTKKINPNTKSFKYPTPSAHPSKRVLKKIFYKPISNNPV